MRSKIILYYNDLMFLPSESFLYKDFGQVPFVLSQLFNTELEYWIAATRYNPELSTFRGKPVRQFRKVLSFLPKKLDFLSNLSLYGAIRNDFDATHVVVFPFSPLSDLLALRLIKRYHPDTKIILKLDTNKSYLEIIARDWQDHCSSSFMKLRQSYHYRELLKLADVVLCETSECERILRRNFLGLALSEKLVRIYSGLSATWLASLGVSPVPDDLREPIIIVSGRISATQKHTALILEVPPPPGWTIEFIGPVDDDLAQTIAAHRDADTQFDQRYRFLGPINDKRTYFDLLMRSRVLLMNSRGGEGFPNVFAEAHYCNLFIVASDVSGTDDATDGGRLGAVYAPDDIEGLRAAFASVPGRLSDRGDCAMREDYRRQFIWEYSLNQPIIRELFAVPHTNVLQK